MSNAHSRQRRKSNRHPRLAIAEPLESRCMLATFVVSSAIDGTPGDLRSAIADANATPGADTITFNLNSLSLTLGEIAIDDEVHLDGASIGHVQILQTTNDRIFLVDDAAPGMMTVSMDELTLRGGDAITGGAIHNREALFLQNSTITGNQAQAGGGVFNQGGLFRMERSFVYDNRADYEGGGIMNVGGVLEIMDSEIRINRVSNNAGAFTFGGGIRNIGGASAVLEDSFVLGNAAYAAPGTYAYGGGIANQLDSVVHLIGSTVGDNYAAHDGGGIWTMDRSWLISDLNPNTGNGSGIFGNVSGESGGGVYLQNSNADLQDTVISGNITELHGGGIHAALDTALTMHNVDVIDNTTNFFYADGIGGGLYATSLGQPLGPVIQILDSRIQRNNVDPNGSAGGEFGGGIGVRYAVDLSIVNSTIADNKASISGGGLYLTDGFSPYTPHTRIELSRIAGNSSANLGGGITAAGGDLQIEQTDVVGNVADAKGGGLFLTGLGSAAPQNVMLRDSLISGNRAPIEGGGIAAGPHMFLTMERSTLDANTTYGRGGGMYVTSLGLAGLAHHSYIVDSGITNNRSTYDPNGPPATEASAGGIWIGPTADVAVTRSTVSGNHADRLGGGMMALQGTLKVTDSTMKGNASQIGGGAYLETSDANFEQNTWSANSALDHGGAIAVRSLVGSNVDLVLETISLNQADRNLDGIGVGGGVFVSDDPANTALVSIDHAIVANNFSGSQLILPHNDDVYDGPGLAGLTPLDPTYSLIGSRQGTLLSVAHPDPLGNIVGSATFPVDPLLSPLGLYGGPTETMVPQAASPAVNGGNPTFSGTNLFDQRQSPFTRVVGTIDMGSTETQSLLPGPDLNFDGAADGDDINLLTNAIANGNYVAGFDMDGNGILDTTDISRWLCKAGHLNLGANLSYRVGDANLDGVVDGIDFLAWNNNKFTANADWTGADFDASGFVDGQDFIQWNIHKFQGPVVCNPSPIVLPNTPQPDAILPTSPTDTRSTRDARGTESPVNRLGPNIHVQQIEGPSENPSRLPSPLAGPRESAWIFYGTESDDQETPSHSLDDLNDPSWRPSW